LATNDFYTKDGQKMESTEWHNLEMWDQQALTAEKYFKKGNLLYVEGKIRTDKYIDAEGIEKQLRKIRVTSFQMMSSANGGSGDQNKSTDSIDDHVKGDVENDNHLS